MDTLDQLLRLSADKLHQHAKEMTRRLECCLYLVGLALLAMEQSQSFRKFNCVDVVQYAVMYLGLARQKANELIRASRALVKLPVLREAFRDGRIGWGKVREVTRVATEETDQEWYDYAMEHTTDEVQRAVTISPRAYRKSLAASEPGLLELCESEPSAQASEDDELARRQPGVMPATTPRSVPHGTAASLREEPVRPIPAGRKIRMVFELTPEEYVRYERAEDRVRSQLGKRISRNEVLMALAETRLGAADGNARAKLPVIMLVDGQTGTGWYETRQGLLPATPEQVEQAVEVAAEIVSTDQPTLFEPELPPCGCHQKRKKISRGLMRRLMARSGGKCENPGCGRGAPLDVDHLKPVSKGGKNTLANCRLLCDLCHPDRHKDDFLPGTPWHEARANSQRRRLGRKRTRGTKIVGPQPGKPSARSG